MKKTIILALLVIGSFLLHAQVGINIETPKATLDVAAKKTDGTTPEGFMAPRLTGDQIALAELQYGVDQKGALVYALDAVTSPTPKTGNITNPGYYYFDGNIWQAFSAGVTAIGGTPFVLSGTATDAQTNKTDAIGRSGIVGIGTTVPYTGSILDVSASDKGLLIPRVSAASSVLAPTDGMMVYDQSLRCFRFYENSAWTECLSTASNQIVKTDCGAAGNGFQGCYISGTAVPTANAFKVTIINNTFQSVSLGTFTATNLVLSGVSGLSVSSVSPSTAVTLTSGGSATITFNLTGTPQSTGTLVGTFTKSPALSCINSIGVNTGGTVSINSTPSVLPVGCTYNFTSPNTGVSWSSTTPGVATIDPINGLVTGVSAGTATITATLCGGITATRTIQIVNKINTFSSAGSSGTLAIPDYATSFVAEAYGGGGGGTSRRLVSSIATRGQGGGGGAYSKKTYGVISGSIAYYVGKGGAASTSTGGYSGGNNGEGTSITYDSVSINALGGNGGCRTSSGADCGGAGGTASGGDINLAGSSATSANGAAAAGPAGGGQQTGGNSLVGQTGNAPGGGGSGALGNSGAPIPGNSNGGAGAAGRVVITFPCP